MGEVKIIEDYAPGDIVIPTRVGDPEVTRPKNYMDISIDVGPGVVATVLGAPLVQPVLDHAINWAINRCARCGRMGHTIFKCYAKTRVDGSRL